MAWVEAHKGKWRGRYRDEAGKVRYATVDASKRRALKAAQDEEAKVRAGTWHDPTAGNMTFSTYFEDHWLPNRTNEVNTLDGYRSHYNATLKGEFGNMPLNKITAGMIQRWVAREQKAGAKPGTIRAKFRTLSTCLAGRKGVSAVRDGLLAVNPCAGVDLPPADEHAEPELFTPDEVDLVMAKLPAWYQPVVVFAAGSGLRWGEILGVTVGDVIADEVHGDLQGGVWVRHTIIEVNKAASGNGTRFAWKPRPKGRQARFVALDPEVLAMIDTVIQERRLSGEDRLFSMPGGGDLPKRTSEWPEGLPIGRSFMRESLWKGACEAAGVKYRKFHALRGTHITWLLTGGLDLITVMDRAGHRHLSTTQVYVARMPNAEARALDALRAGKARLALRSMALSNGGSSVA